MAQVRVLLPRLLAPMAGGERDFKVEANTVAEALEAVRARTPLLRNALDDEGGRQRPHVQVFYNEIETMAVQDLAAPASDGDEILVVQAISGG